MSIDSIGDFLTIIRNGLMASKRSVVCSLFKIKYAIAQILKKKVSLKNFEVVRRRCSKKSIKDFFKIC